MELTYGVCKVEALIPVRSAEPVGGPKTPLSSRPLGSACANDDKKYDERQAKDDERCGLGAVRAMQSQHRCYQFVRDDANDRS